MMTVLQVEQTDQGTAIRLHDSYEVARMHMASDDRGKRKLHLVVNDTGDATLDLVLALFRYLKAMGEIPIVD
jgi:hypothetical protein